MNRKRLLLYVIFIAYQGGAFFFTYLVDGHLDLLALLRFVVELVAHQGWVLANRFGPSALARDGGRIMTQLPLHEPHLNQN